MNWGDIDVFVLQNGICAYLFYPDTQPKNLATDISSLTDLPNLPLDRGRRGLIFLKKRSKKGGLEFFTFKGEEYG